MLKKSKSVHDKLSRSSRRTSAVVRSRTTNRASILPNEDFVENLVVIPPDGGWGWLVVAMAFICNFLVDGTMYTFGVFLDEVSKSFNVHPTKIALASSLMSGFYYIVGPFTCAIANRYGFRIVGTLGGAIAAIAFYLSTMFDSLTAFLLLIGCLCGIGFNMIYIPSLLVVGFYFERWRALATGLSVTGSSIGVIAFPPIITKVLKRLSWKMKFRILSGLTMATIICTFVYKPIKPVKFAEDKKFALLGQNDSDSIGTFHIEKEDTINLKKIFQRFHNTVFPTLHEVHKGSSTFSNLSTITEDTSTFLALLDSDPSIARSLFTARTDAQSVGVSTVYEDESKCKVNCCRKKCWKEICWCCCCCCNCCRATTGRPIVNRPMYRDDIFFTGSLYTVPEYSRSRATVVSGGPSARKSAVSYHMSVSRVPTQKDIEQNEQCLCCPEAVVRTIATMLDIRLLKSPSFMVLTLSGFFTMIGMYCPFIFVIQRAEDMQIEQKWCVFLLTLIGISNTVGRILSGVISSFPQMDALIISYVTLFISGGIIVLSNYLNTLEGQITFAVLFGLNSASFTALRPVVLVNLLGLENLTNAFGITTLFFGIGSFLGVPISAMLQNYTGKYEASFLFSGCALMLSAILMVPTKAIARWEANRKKPKVTFRT